MIRFVDSIEAETEYVTACNFDAVYGAINSFLYKIYFSRELGLFWIIYDDDGMLLGNLSFANDTFTVCLKDSKCVDELSEFINFWGNFKFIKYDLRKVINLDKLIKIPCKLATGTLFEYNLKTFDKPFSLKICKDIKLYDVFSVLKECFPEKMSDFEFSDFNYDMNYRLRKGESFLYAVKLDDEIASIIEVMCCHNDSFVIGGLATREKYRNLGLASSLLSYVLQKFPNCTGYVFADSDSVSGYYRKLGFKKFTSWAQLSAL